MNRRGFLKALLGTGLAVSSGVTVLAQENGSNFDKLSKLKSLLKQGRYQIFNEENITKEDSFLLVCLKDVHGRAVEDEIRFIEEIIITQSNISHLFFEGWSGHQADSDRGFKSYSGEEEVVKYFVENGFNVIGLEREEERNITRLLLNYRDYKYKEIATKWNNEGDDFLLNPTFDSIHEEVYFNNLSSYAGSNEYTEDYVRIFRTLLENDSTKRELFKTYINSKKQD